MNPVRKNKYNNNLHNLKWKRHEKDLSSGVKIIGITGGYKTGKSTVTQVFKKHGAITIDADAIARKALEKETTPYKQTVNTFGKNIQDAEGKINREKLASLVFNNRGKLEKLNKIIHPYVKSNIQKQLNKIKSKQSNATVVLDVPLLFEAGLEDIMDKIIVVKTTEDIQVLRAKRQTSLSDEKIKKRIRSQMPLAEKEKLADIVIDNNRNIEETKRQVDRIWREMNED
jgi:dephospho-CoA kinase